MIKNRSWWTYL